MKKTTRKAPRAATPSSATTPKRTKVPTKKIAAAPAEPPATFISVKLDIGFGNVLFVRGDGPGMSWDKGLAMENVATDLWTAAIKGATKPVVFKLLVNDLTWSAGEDFAIAPGQSVTLTPTF